MEEPGTGTATRCQPEEAAAAWRMCQKGLGLSAGVSLELGAKRQAMCVPEGWRFCTAVKVGKARTSLGCTALLGWGPVPQQKWLCRVMWSCKSSSKALGTTTAAKAAEFFTLKLFPYWKHSERSVSSRANPSPASEELKSRSPCCSLQHFIFPDLLLIYA